MKERRPWWACRPGSRSRADHEPPHRPLGVAQAPGGRQPRPLGASQEPIPVKKLHEFQKKAGTSEPLMKSRVAGALPGPRDQCSSQLRSTTPYYYYHHLVSRQPDHGTTSSPRPWETAAMHPRRRRKLVAVAPVAAPLWTPPLAPHFLQARGRVDTRPGAHRPGAHRQLTVGTLRKS